MKREAHLEFLPAVLEVQETPPSPAGRIILWVIVLLITTSVIWAACSQVDIVAVTRGRLVASALSRPVSSAVVAEIEKVLVHDGMHVQKGQILIVLNSRVLQSRYDENALRQKINRFHIARLTLLRRNMEDVEVVERLPEPFFEEDAGLAQQLSNQLKAETDNVHLEKAVLHERIRVLEAQKTGFLAQQAQNEKLLSVLREQHQALQALYKKQVASRDNFLEIQKRFTEAHYAVEYAVSRVEELERGCHQARAELDSRMGTVVDETEKQLSGMRNENDVLSAQLLTLQAQLAQYTLRSPVDGVVDSLLFRDAGGAVDAPQELLKIVPDNETLQAEVVVSNKDVGFLQSNQEVTLKIDTFDFTRYGWVSGRLKKISADASEDKDLGLIYKATIDLSSRQIRTGEHELWLEPGMQVTAEIKTGKRTVLSFLLSPIVEALHRVGKER